MVFASYLKESLSMMWLKYMYKKFRVKVFNKMIFIAYL